jgi:prohibitin 2
MGVEIMKMLKALAVLGSLLVMTGCGMQTVDTGHRGVETRFGKVVSESLPEGLHWYNPFTSAIAVLDTRVQRWEGKTSAYTKDVQQADITFVLNYRLDPRQVHVVYQEVGTDWASKLIGQVVLEEIKKEIGHHEAVNLVSNREKASQSIAAGVVEKLQAKNVIVTGFQLANIDYTSEFEHAVEAKVVAAQRAIEEANRTVQIKEQKAQSILKAEAEAESIRIRANALEQNAKLVEWEAVQKWDGKMPVTMIGGGSVPFIQIPAK